MAIFIGALFVIVCVLLIIIVLLQKGRGGGVSAAFGGGGSHSAFGTRTGDVLTWVTVVLVSVFIILSLVAVLQWRPSNLEQARMPGFEPAGRYIDQPLTITMSATGNEPESKIHYTTDGSAPTRVSEQYTTPLRLQPGTTVKAFVSAPGWHDSNVIEMSYPRATAENPVGKKTQTQLTGKAAAASKPASSLPALPVEAVLPAGATLPAAR